ncbi:hypothetical protein Dimus_010079 [Dionaea muscipula]
MSDHVDPVHDLFEFTQRCFCFFAEWFYTLFVRRPPKLVWPLLNSSFFEDSKGHHSSCFSPMSTIQISSDDSIFDADGDDGEVVSPPAPSAFDSSTRRILPDWASSAGAGIQIEGSGAKNASSSNSVTSQGRSYTNFHPQHGAHSYPSYNADTRTSSYRTHLNDDFRYSKENGSNGQAARNNLPFPHSNSNPTYNGRSSRIHDVWKSHDSSDHGRSTLKDDDEDIVMLDSSGRVLPPTLIRARPAIPAHYNSSVDPLLRAGIGEGANGHDERLIYEAALQDLSQQKQEIDLPYGLLSVPLLRHQKIALAWMLQKETKSVHCLGGILADDQGLGKTISMIALIQMQKLCSKSKSEDQPDRKAEALNLDDDDEDANKSNNENTEGNGDSRRVQCSQEASSSQQAVQRKRPAAGTLVICPATVLRQWARELDEKAGKEAKLTVLVYHGGNRTKDPSELAKYDVVLTTYSIVTNEVQKQPLIDEEDVEKKVAEEYGLSSELSMNRKRKNPSDATKKGKKGRKGIDSCSVDSDSGALGRVSWLRVVLDEAQTIKNHRTQVARACSGLRAKTRWCLSGTPIQNAIDELFSYFRFLKYDPYDKYKAFVDRVKVPISREPVRGFKKLQAVLRAVMLRRTKETLLDGTPIIKLPPKNVELQKVNFTAEERSFYTKLETESRIRFKEYAAAGTVNQNYASILLMLLRLRQACDHPVLVKGLNTNSAGRASVQIAKQLPKRLLIDLLHHLEASSAICQVCSDPPEDAVVSKCGHVFCYQCVVDHVTGDDNTCPASRCKEQLSDDVIFSKPTLRSCLSADADADAAFLPTDDRHDVSSLMTNEYSSSKIRAALEILQSNSKPRDRCIVLDDPVDCDQDSLEADDAKAHRTTVDSSFSEGPVLVPGPPIKTIIFSQWTSMLDLLEISLNQSCIQYRRLDGTMSLAARDRAVREFNTDPEVMVMVMSLKAGNLGLNMVAASHVILLDLWWNPSTEDQAVDRAHRIGQTRPVTVSRLTVKDTVEDRILALQEEKRKMVASAFGEDKTGSSGARLTIGDLKYLFDLPN